MARLPYLDPDDMEPDDRSLLDRPINLARVLAHSPGGARAFMKMGRWIRFSSALDPRLREMAILRVGVVTRASYEYSHHVKIGREFGLTDDDIRAVVAGPEQGRLGPLEQLVVRAADEMTTSLAMTPATFDGLSHHLDTERLVELTLVIAYYNAVVRFLETMEVDVEPDYQPLLDQFPLPPA